MGQRFYSSGDEEENHKLGLERRLRLLGVVS